MDHVRVLRAGGGGLAPRFGESACNKFRDTEALEDGCPSGSGT